MEKIAEGAEAQIMKIDDNILEKIRLPKTYRLEQIDNKIRKFRCKREFKVLTKLFEKDVNVPEPYDLFVEEDKISFTFKYLDGDILKEVLDENLLFEAFNQIIRMHSLDIVHGDLTTLNMILFENKIYLIDFGLSEFSRKVEDKAVDLNLFFTCIKNEHPDFYFKKEDLEEIYIKESNLGEKIIKRLKEIEKRGRNK